MAALKIGDEAKIFILEMERNFYCRLIHLWHRTSQPGSSSTLGARVVYLNLFSMLGGKNIIKNDVVGVGLGSR
jgi:hypothetical protein